MPVAAKPSPINGVAVEQMFATIEAVKATPSIAKFKFRVNNQWATGSQNRSVAPLNVRVLPCE